MQATIKKPTEAQMRATYKKAFGKEFDSPDMPGSGNLMDENFLEMLDEVRDKFGKPIVINSGYRSEEHNAAVGGKPKTETSRGSSHMYGLAADIKCDNSVDRFHFLSHILCSEKH